MNRNYGKYEVQLHLPRGIPNGPAQGILVSEKGNSNPIHDVGGTIYQPGRS